MITDIPAFIARETRMLPVPHAPEISLHVADEATELWQKTEDELEAIGLPPPFWAFAWAGGQALARYILDNPAIVQGKSVLDFACGSGLVGIAAMKAGARSAHCIDIDGFAFHAAHINARANGVSLEVQQADIIGQDKGWEVILAGDVCYQRDMTEAVINWLAPLAANGRMVLIGDPGRTYLPRDRLGQCAEYQIKVSRSLEDSEIKKTAVWRLLG